MILRIVEDFDTGGGANLVYGHKQYYCHTFEDAQERLLALGVSKQDLPKSYKEMDGLELPYISAQNLSQLSNS